MLLKKVEHPQLQDAFNTLRVRSSMQAKVLHSLSVLTICQIRSPNCRITRYPGKCQELILTARQSRETRNVFEVEVRNRLVNTMASTCLMAVCGPVSTRILGTNS